MKKAFFLAVLFLCGAAAFAQVGLLKNRIPIEYRVDKHGAVISENVSPSFNVERYVAVPAYANGIVCNGQYGTLMLTPSMVDPKNTLVEFQPYTGRTHLGWTPIYVIEGHSWTEFQIQVVSDLDFVVKDLLFHRTGIASFDVLPYVPKKQDALLAKAHK